MTERDQLLHICHQNGRLEAENRRLRNQLWRHAERIDDLEQVNDELQQAKVDLGAKLEACDALLGAAMDDALGAQRR